MPGTVRSLKALRSRIDEVDLRILRLLEERARWAAAVAKVKKHKGRPLYSGSREEEIFRRLLSAGDGSFPAEGLQNVFHEIITACLNLQKRSVGTGRTMENNGGLSGVADAIRGLPEYQPGQRRGKPRGDLVRLSGNENNYGASPAVHRAAAGALRSLHLYPDKWATDPRRAIARVLRVQAEEVVLGNGSDELMDLIFRMYLRAGKEALLPHPSFTYYEIAARACGARAVFFPLVDYQYDISRVRAKVCERTALVVLANPNNPTGTYIPRRELSDLLKSLPTHVIVLLDEAYWGYPEAGDFPDGMQLRRRHPNLIVMRTFSKSHGMAGLRCAFAVCEKAMAGVLNKLRQPFNVNRVAQAAAAAAIRDRRWQATMWKRNQSEKLFLESELRRLGLRVVPSQANFLLVIPPRRASRLVERLAQQNIWVRDTASFGISGGFRVTVGKRAESKRLVNALASILE
ncbi:MAG: histidinol-phosphate transaminase [Nitrospirae bacterium]|nr:histidinol-phosphate transaminase [Nitrospirota bacterium]